MIKRTVNILLAAALLALAGQLPAYGRGDPEAVAARTRLYAQLADHNLLQIMLVVPVGPGKTILVKHREGRWDISGDVLCVDVGALREEIETREVRELPEEARKQPIAAAEFYRAVRFEPPRLVGADEDRDHAADLTAALTRFAAAKFARKVAVDLAHGAAGCNPDAYAVPAIRFFKRAHAQPGQATWFVRMERGELVTLGTLGIGELRAARGQRLAMTPTGQPAGVRGADQVKRATASREDVAYGALRIETGRFKICYAAGEDPLPQLVAWALADSDKAKRWMNATPETPKAIADLDAILADFRKPSHQRSCTLLVATTAALTRVKMQLEREKLVPALYPETVGSAQVLAAYGFRNLEELKFARDIGAESSELFALLRNLGLGHREGYDLALRRYSWQLGAAKPDAETLASFVRDEREAAAKGMSVKALRAERAKREDAKSRRVSAVSG